MNEKNENPCNGCKKIINEIIENKLVKVCNCDMAIKYSRPNNRPYNRTAPKK
jgi:hypothetical protein